MKKGFTLIELMAIIVLLAVVIAMMVPTIIGVIESSKKDAFMSDVKSIIREINNELASGTHYDLTQLDVDDLKNVFQIDTKNIYFISTEDINGEIGYKVIGKNEWEGYLARGTYENIEILEATTPPTIALYGSSTVIMEVGQTYVEAGATAQDSLGFSLDSRITIGGTVNNAVAGTYVLTYNVEDYTGNTASITRTISVIATAIPTVVFGTNGNATYAKTRTTTVTVSDNVALNTSSLEYQWTTSTTAPTEASFTTTFTNGATLSTPAGVSGGYYLWILAKDLVGNTMIARSNVFNLDNVAPVITISGAAPITQYQFSTYTDAGATAIDNIEGNITAGLVVTGVVTPNTIGSYTISYSSTDTAGNTATQTRSVIINPNTNCLGVKTSNPSAFDGVYTIDPNGGNNSDQFNVYCDMTTDGGGWTLVWSNLKNFTNRPVTTITWSNATGSGVWYNGTLSANKETFEVYMGLTMWNSILNNVSGLLRFEWRYDFGVAKTQEAKFTIAPFTSGNNYAISLSNLIQLTGSVAPGLWSSHNGNAFSTYDSDHDSHSGSCSSFYSNTPWWYNACWSGNFNGGGQNSGSGYYNGAYWTGSTQSWGTTAGAGAGNGWLWLK